MKAYAQVKWSKSCSHYLSTWIQSEDCNIDSRGTTHETPHIVKSNFIPMRTFQEKRYSHLLVVSSDRVLHVSWNTSWLGWQSMIDCWCSACWLQAMNESDTMYTQVIWTLLAWNLRGLVWRMILVVLFTQTLEEQPESSTSSRISRFADIVDISKCEYVISHDSL